MPVPHKSVRPLSTTYRVPTIFNPRAHNPATMGIEVNPRDIQNRTTDDRGRAYLGPEYANSTVHVAVLGVDE